MRSVEKIKELTCRVPFLENPEVSFLAEGYGNYNYLVQEGDTKYVLRIKKSGEVQFVDSLEKEYIFLKYFKSQGINFCPDVYFFDHEENFLVEGFLEGTELSQKDFSNKHIDLFASQLCGLYTLDVSGFSSFCIKNKCKEFKYESPLVSLDKYGFERFEEARKAGLDDVFCGWIEKHLKINLSYLETIEREEEPGFNWGDIQSTVIVKGEQNMFFYDFEHATISNSFGLPYIKIHGTFNNSQFDFLVERCSFYFNKTVPELIDKIKAEERVIRTNDVVWAAMMWAKTGDDKFKNKMLERIELAEKLD